MNALATCDALYLRFRETARLDEIERDTRAELLRAQGTAPAANGPPEVSSPNPPAGSDSFYVVITNHRNADVDELVARVRALAEVRRRPRVTVTDDDWVRSHEEVRQLLHYACLGATVIVEPIEREHQPSMGRWTVVLDAAETLATSSAEIYALPCLGAPLAHRARNLCNDAQEALRRHRRKA